MEPEKKPKSPWFWVGIGCAIMTVGLIAFVAFVMFVAVGAMHSSTPYREAVDRATSDPRVIELLGSPVKRGWLVSGSVSTENREGSANLSTTLKGPKGKATLHVKATKTRGRWTYTEMIVTPKTGPEIDLLGTPASPPAGPQATSPARRRDAA